MTGAAVVAPVSFDSSSPLLDDVELRRRSHGFGAGLRAPVSGTASQAGGHFFLERHDNDQAIADFTEAIRLNPRYSTAYANRSDAWRLKGDLDRSVAHADQTIALDPTDPLNYTRCADTRRCRDDYTQSPAGRSLCLWFPTRRRAVLFCCGQMTN
jgi:tetratricopeptide (TPR) repeat protein